MATYSNSAREVEMPDGNVVVLHSEPTGGANTTSNIKKFKYDDNGHVTESTAANATDLNLSSYSTPTTGTTDIGTSDAVQTAIGKLDHQSKVDQSNILYAINKVGKNAAKETTKTIDILAADHYRIYCDKISGNIHIHFDSLTSTDTDGTTIQANLHYTDDTTGSIIQLERGTNINVDVNAGDKVVNWLTIFSADTWSHSAGDTATATGIVICSQDVWTNDPTFTEYALPNYDLTRLEAEDRAALAEEIDAGAKQLAQGQNNSGSAGTATIQSDGYTVKLTGSAASSSSLSFATTGTIQKTGTYVFAIEASGTMDRISIWDNTASASVETLYATGSKEVTLTAGHSYALFHFAGSAMTLNATVKYMICTKAAFGVSQKFVPYRKPYADALSVLDKRAPKGTDGTVSGGSMDDFDSGCVLCTPNVTGGPQQAFCYVRTRVYDSNCTLQQVFYPVDNTAYQRCKWSDTWSEWKQFVS